MAKRNVSSTSEESSVMPQMLLLDGLANPSNGHNMSDVSPLLARVRDFLPQMAAANEALSSEECPSSGIDIVNVHDGQHTDESDNESATEREDIDQPHIEIDISVFKGGNRNSHLSDSSSSEDSEVDSELPEAFRTSRENDKTDSATKKQKTRKRKLIEEVEED